MATAVSAPQPASLDLTGYAQLHLTVTVQGEGSGNTFDEWPDKNLWNIDLSKPLGEDEETNLAIYMVNPDGPTKGTGQGEHGWRSKPKADAR